MLPLIVIAVILALSLLLYHFIIYPGFVSPLAKIPNLHFTSPYCSWWIQSKKKNGRTGVRHALAAHRKYGPVIRISKHELSVISLDGLRKIYTGGFEKTEWYRDMFQNFDTPNLVAMVTNKPHSIQKRMLANVYSKTYIQSSEDLSTLSRVLLHDRLFPALEEAATSGAPFDVYGFHNAIGADFMNAFLFGTANGTDFIRDVSARDEFMKHFRIKYKGLPGEDEAGKEVEKYVLAWCDAAEKGYTEGAIPNMSLPPTKPVVHSQLLSRLTKDTSSLTNSPRIVAASEMMDHLAASVETARIVFTYLEWEMSRRPELMSALRKELLTLSPPIKFDPRSKQPLELPDPKEVDALPLLNAILKETLRLYSPSPSWFPRTVPPSGTVIDGYAIPGGVSVASAGYCIHRNEEVYPEPESFNPDRWLKSGSKGVDGVAGARTEQDRWFWVFGSGGRMCIGSHFAVFVMKLCVAAIYTNYTTTVVDDEGIEQEDAFLAGPVGEKLVLKFHKFRE